MILSDLDPAILIIGGALIFSILIFFIILFIFLYQRRHHRFMREKQDLHNSFQRELLKTQLETQEETLHIMGEELHDNIGQLLSSTRMLLGIAERSLPQVPDAMRTANETLAQAIQHLRMLSKSLNREWLSRFDLVQNLQAEASRINAARTVNVQVHVAAKVLPLSAEAQVMLFRVIQEGLQNSLKHAQAQDIDILLDVAQHIRVTITDDGRGFVQQGAADTGVGLLNMKHRISLLNGTIQWQPAPGGGTRVTIQLPKQTLDV